MRERASGGVPTTSRCTADLVGTAQERLCPPYGFMLTVAIAAGGAEAKRAFEAMMGMKKIDVAAIEAARRG